MERSKLFKTMGWAIGLKEVRKTHRGFIAKTVLPRVEAWEDFEFKKAMKRISFRYIKVTNPLTGEVNFI